MPGGGRDPFAVQMSAAMKSCTMRTVASPDKHSLRQAAQYRRVLLLVFERIAVFAALGMKKIVPVAGLAALLLAAQPINNADAVMITQQITPNFEVTANYLDDLALFTINYTGPTNSLLYGNKVNLKDVYFGGALSASPGWTKTSTQNLNGPVNYHMNSTNTLDNIQPFTPFNFGFDYAAQNGVSVPAGIGSEALTDFLNISITDSFRTYNGQIAAPYSLTHTPQQNESPPVPEPGTMALLGLGLAGLAVYGKRKSALPQK